MIDDIEISIIRESLVSHQSRITDKKQLREWLRDERRIYGAGEFQLFLKRVLGYEYGLIWSFQKRLRKTEYYMNTGRNIRAFISRILLNRISNRTCLRIMPNVCGKGLHIMHVGPILTNSRAKTGENCVLHMNTALVAHGRNNSAPLLGDNIVVGVGATVLGNVILADGIAVGANALVNKTFLDEGIAIAGVPAHKISDNGRMRWNQGE